MADEQVKTVERELLTGHMYVGGRDRKRGDVVELTEEQAERLDELGATAEVGTLEKLAEQQAEAEEAQREAEQAAAEARETAAREAGRVAQAKSGRRGNNIGDDGQDDDETATSGKGESGESDKGEVDKGSGEKTSTATGTAKPAQHQARSSQDGPKTTRSDTGRATSRR